MKKFLVPPPPLKKKNRVTNGAPQSQTEVAPRSLFCGMVWYGVVRCGVVCYVILNS